jgi:hypothetical protein
VSPPLARPVFGINHVIAYGQSLASGWEGWPALSTTPRHDCLMLGRSVRPRDENRPTWLPVGEAAFHPLAATVQERESGALLSPAQAAGLPPRATALGETVLEAAVNHWRGRMLAEDPGAAAHPLLASTCGVGGRTLAALSKGARPEMFLRLRDCAALARQTAATTPSEPLFAQRPPPPAPASTTCWRGCGAGPRQPAAEPAKQPTAKYVRAS